MEIPVDRPRRACSVERVILHYEDTAESKPPPPSLLGGADDFALQAAIMRSTEQARRGVFPASWCRSAESSAPPTQGRWGRKRPEYEEMSHARSLRTSDRPP